ncbi:MAG: EamA family transporter [Phaeodactylibacter sp.]|nr:EamA family transporter [Phaeodactylibacter sp.]MCB9301258.1 EamA family transporter [Lewinellaceae bacterium]
MQLQPSQRFLIIASFAAIYLIWGSTYLFNYFAIQDIPPFLMAGSRFLVAGLLLYALSWKPGAVRPTRRQWANAARMGFLFLSVGTGGTVWAEQYVDTGIAALLISLQPLLVVSMMWAMQGKRPGGKVLFGILLGIIGMAFLVGQQRFVTNQNTLIGMLVIGVSMTSWCFGSVTLSKTDLPQNRLQSSAMQMISGGIILLLIALLNGNMMQFDITAVSLKAGLSWIILVLFGSIVAFSAFTYLLQQVSPDKVATSNYVNPVVAMWLGWAFNSELINGQSILAALLMLAGVFFMNSRLQVKRRPPGANHTVPGGRRLWKRAEMKV